MKKKILAVILCLTFVMSAFSAIAVFADEAADTTPVVGFTQDDEKKELRASTAEGLMALAEAVNKGGISDYNIFIDADIDLTGFEWKPIAAASGNAYSGVIDGQGYTIKAINAVDYTNSFGFVGYAISGGAIKNLHLEGINVTSTKPYNGALIGRLYGGNELGAEFVIENCTTQGALHVNGANYAGGLVGALHNGNPQTVVDEEGVEKTVYYPPCLRVENCAVNMNLSASTNYAAGILGGDSFTKDGDAPAGASPKVTCNNVFVTGTYESPSQASGFIGYCNLATLIVENCFSAAEINGADDVSGSFFTRTRKSQLTVRNCYSICDRPFSGEIENFGTMKDADGNVIDGMNIINSYALKATGVDAEGNPTAELVDPKVCVKFTYKAKPVAPEAGADAETVKKYEDALKFYNEYPVVTINAVNYTVEQIVNVKEGESGDVNNTDVKLTVPSLPEQELLHLADEVAATLFAADSKQAALVEAYMIARKCPHTETAEVVDGIYLATNATCTAKATYYKSCVACKMALKDLDTFEAGETAPHTWAERWGYDEEAGTHAHYCTVCKSAKTDEATHTFGEWEVDKEATVTKEGLKVRECSVCGFEEEEAIPKLDPPPADQGGDNAGGDNAGNTTEEKKGCGGAIGGASIIIMLAAAGAVVARKKED